MVFKKVVDIDHIDDIEAYTYSLYRRPTRWQIHHDDSASPERVLQLSTPTSHWLEKDGYANDVDPSI